MKKIFLAVIILCACVSAVAQDVAYEYRTFTSADGKTLNYRLLTPDEEAKGKKFPLVVFLHGAGHKGGIHRDAGRKALDMQGGIWQR